MTITKNDNKINDSESKKQIFEFTISEYDDKRQNKGREMYTDVVTHTINVPSTPKQMLINTNEEDDNTFNDNNNKNNNNNNKEIDIPVLHEGCSTTCQMVDKEVISKSLMEEKYTQYEDQVWSNDQIQRVISHDERFKEFLKTVFPLMMYHLEESIVFSKVLGKDKF
uniref:HSF_DOMAIN domain-containing protein n=1 Tax=Strongyloides papillosus TaxID=174720 RepID=A0A0N5BQG4_STREA